MDEYKQITEWFEIFFVNVNNLYIIRKTDKIVSNDVVSGKIISKDSNSNKKISKNVWYM